jgi:hypothetical protein
MDKYFTTSTSSPFLRPSLVSANANTLYTTASLSYVAIAKFSPPFFSAAAADPLTRGAAARRRSALLKEVASHKDTAYNRDTYADPAMA